MRKTLYLIGGTMGVGKTSVSRELKKKLNNAVFLDGDWCWNANPFQVTNETKKMVLENICFLLNQFIHCSSYENIIFCWVMHEQGIIDSILDKLDKKDLKIESISITANEETLTARLQKDIDNGIREADIVKRSVARIPLYQLLNTKKVETDNKSVSEIADEIIKLR